MVRRTLAGAFLLALAAPALADEKFDTKKLKGAWLREVQGTKLRYTFKDGGKMTAKLTPQGADKSVIVEVDYTVDKNGVINGVITKVEAPEGAEGLPAKGDKFSMKVEVGKETIIVSDFKGVGDNDVKQLVEGEYKKQTD